MNGKPNNFLGEGGLIIGHATRSAHSHAPPAAIRDAFGGSSPVTFSGNWLVQNTFDGFDRNVASTDPTGGTLLGTFDPGGRGIAARFYGSPGGPTPADNSGSGNVLLASAEARFDEAGRQYEAQRDVFLDGGTYYRGVGGSLPSGRTVTHTGGAWFSNADTQAAYSGCRYVFTGREYDAETEIYFFRARYYSPRVGRFLGRDPLDYADGSNFYEAVRSAPTVGVDPRGTSIHVRGRPGFPAEPLSTKVFNALSAICPCIKLTVYTRRDGNGDQIEMQTWTKGGRDYPYDPNDPASKRAFCDCYTADPDVGKQVAGILGNAKRGAAGAVARQLEAIKGNRGHRYGCSVVMRALAQGNEIVGIKGDNTVVAQDVPAQGLLQNDVGWMPDTTLPGNLGAGAPTENLGHELIHRTFGIGGGGPNEYSVSRYENLIRFELGVRLRRVYTSVDITQSGPIMREFATEDCEC